MRLAVSLPNVGSPRELVDFVVGVEQEGAGLVLLWDGLQHEAKDELETVDPWTVLGAMATATSRIRLGTGVTPIARRPPWKLAKELITLDHLSGGRAVLGVGLGAPEEEEFRAFGDRATAAERASRTDEGLEILDQLLRGHPVDHKGEYYEIHAHLRPGAAQSPRPPIWTAATWPYRRPLARAARWDGVFCNVKIDDDGMPLTPQEVSDYVGELAGRDGFDVAVMRHPGHGPDEYEQVGVTWLVEGWWPRGDDWLTRFRRRVSQVAADFTQPPG